MCGVPPLTKKNSKFTVLPPTVTLRIKFRVFRLVTNKVRYTVQYYFTDLKFFFQAIQILSF